MIEIVILLLMTLLSSVASLMLKKSTCNGLNVFVLMKNLWLYLGGIVYVLAALFNIYLLRILPYSVVLPSGSLTYVWTLVLSNRFLGENITRHKIIGISFIVLGVICMKAI